jgi:hypothetical protein
VSYTLFFPEAM